MTVQPPQMWPILPAAQTEALKQTREDMLHQLFEVVVN